MTHRDASASFAIVTGHRKEDAAEEVKWGNLAKGVETLAVYMGLAIYPICEQLMKHGKDKVRLPLLLSGELHLCSAQLLGR